MTMITDAMVEAAARAAYGDHFQRYLKMMRRALDAALAEQSRPAEPEGRGRELLKHLLDLAREEHRTGKTPDDLCGGATVADLNDAEVLLARPQRPAPPTKGGDQ